MDETRLEGYHLVAQSLKAHGVEALFFLLGAPTIHYVWRAQDLGIRCIDVRHEQVAAMMAQGYARVTRKVGVCSGASGPGVMNLMTGVATAHTDAMPVLVLGGSSPMGDYEKGAFQDLDQVTMMRPITKWAARVHDPHRIPEYIKMALQRAVSGRPGPVYLDLPADVMYQSVDPAKVRWPRSSVVRSRTAADPVQIGAAVDQLLASRRPIVITGSGALLSGAEAEVQALAETLGIPVYTTPQGRGIIPEDHRLSLYGARTSAFRSADTVLLVGTRLNYVIRHGEAPHFSPDLAVIQVEADPEEAGANYRVTVPVNGDAAMVLGQIRSELQARGARPEIDGQWLQGLAAKHAARLVEIEGYANLDQQPIHPLRLCWELKQFLPRDAILSVDGQEILNYARQTIPTYVAGHRLNSGTLGCMGVGLPLALGAKVANPERLVVALSGDGSFGMNSIDLDTAVRHRIPVLVVISNNGGWTSNDPPGMPGRNLGFTRYDEMFRPLGCHTEYVTAPGEIQPALVRAGQAVRGGQVALVNVITDPMARAHTAPFASYPSRAQL